MAGLFNSTLADLLKKFSDTFDIKGQTPFYQDPGAASVGVTTPVERTDLNLSEYTSVPGAAREYEKWSQGNYPLTYSSNPMNEVDPSVGLGIKQGRLSDTIDAAMLPVDALGIASMFKAPVKATARILVPEAAERLDRIVPKFAIKEPSLEPNRVLAPRDKYGFYSAVEEEALNLKRKSGNGQAYINDLLKGQNVKKEEMDWIGLTDWLKEKKNVTKEEIQQFVADNKVTIKERVRVNELGDRYVGEWKSTKWLSRIPELGDFYYGESSPFVIKKIFPQVGDLNEYAEFYNEPLASELKQALTNYVKRNKNEFPNFEAVSDFPENHPEYKIQLSNSIKTLTDKIEDESFSLAKQARTYARQDDVVGSPEYSDWAMKSQTYPEEITTAIEKNKVRTVFTPEEAEIWNDPIKRNKLHWDDYIYLQTKANIDSENLVYPQRFHKSHYPDLQHFSHRREGTVQTVSGDKLRMNMEIQGDWAQSGEKQGFNNFVALKAADNLEYSGGSAKRNWEFVDAQTGEVLDTYNGPESTALKYVEEWNNNTYPDMPFKNSNWIKLQLKRTLRRAAEKDIDNLGFSTGEMQNVRYQKTNNIKRILSSPVNKTEQRLRSSKYRTRKDNVDLKYHVELYPKEKFEGISDYKLDLYLDKDGIVSWIDPTMHNSPYIKEFMNRPLDKVIPKEYADQILNSNEVKNFEGVSFKVNNRGMEQAYDKTQVNILNELGKPYGVKVEEDFVSELEPLSTRFELAGYSPEDFKNFNVDQLIKKIKKDNNGKFPEWFTKDDIKWLNEKYNLNKFMAGDSFGPQEEYKKRVYKYKMNEAMKKALLEKGQPLFSAAPAASLIQQEDEEDIFNNPLMREPFDITLP